MAHLTPNQFTSWDLDEEEERQGSMYTITQIQVLQNMQAAQAEEKIALEYNPADPDLFIQQEAYKRGQIQLIQFIIDNSAAFTEELATEARPEFNLDPFTSPVPLT